MPTPVTSIAPVSAASPSADAATPGLVLQAGSVVDARVVSVLADNLVRIAIANLSLDVMSEVPLSPGQNLQLAVSRNDGTVHLAVVGGTGEAAADVVTLTPRAASLVESPPLAPSMGAARNTLTPPEQVAVTVASADAVTRQGSQAPLFANLAAVVTGSDLPAGLKQAVLAVLAQQTPLDTGLAGGDIESAFQKSGLFLEASLAAGATPSSGTMPDLKAALLVLRQALATIERAVPPTQGASPAPAAGGAAQAGSPSAELAQQPQMPRSANPAAAVLADIAGGASQAATSRTMSAGLAASLLQEVTQNLPRLTGNVPGSNKAVPDGHVFEAAARATPPPFRGALPAPQSIAAPSLAPATPLAATVHRLLDDTDAALARQTLLQIASLPRSHRCQRAPHRSGRAAVEFRDSVRDPAGHGDGAVRDLARWRQRVRRSCPAHLARALLPQCGAGRTRACVDHAERRQDLRADVGGAAGDGAAAPCRRR
ncbi:hypothetical protein ACVME5_004479 [Bradyrhizobium liaoningense]